MTVRPGDAVVRVEARHLGFCCISGQQWCDRHPQLVRSAGGFRQRLGVPALRARGFEEASKAKAPGDEVYQLRLLCLLCTWHLCFGFMLDPRGQVKSLANSAMFENGPWTLNMSGEWTPVRTLILRALGRYLAHQTLAALIQKSWRWL